MIGVIGTGSMGSAIAEGLLAAGRTVTVWNRTKAKAEALQALGARIAESPRKLIEMSELIITVLPDAAATREVLFAPDTRGCLRGKLLLNVAHTSPEEIMELAQAVGDVGAILSEVNVTVYPDPVRNRRGHFNVACAEQYRDTWISVFRELGDHVHYVGPVGNASKAELALWLSYMFLPAAIAYSTAAFVKLGLPQEALISALSENPTLRIAGAESLVPQMVSGNYRRDSYSVDNFAYSVHLVMGDAHRLGLPTEIFSEIEKLFKKASELGRGAYDISAVYEVLKTS